MSRNLMMRAASANYAEVRRLEAEVERLKAENERLHNRLEDDREYVLMGDGTMHLQMVIPGSIPDGIECRDQTIKLLEDVNMRLEEQFKAERKNVLRLQRELKLALKPETGVR